MHIIIIIIKHNKSINMAIKRSPVVVDILSSDKTLSCHLDILYTNSVALQYYHTLYDLPQIDTLTLNNIVPNISFTMDEFEEWYNHFNNRSLMLAHAVNRSSPIRSAVISKVHRALNDGRSEECYSFSKKTLEIFGTECKVKAIIKASGVLKRYLQLYRDTTRIQISDLFPLDTPITVSEFQCWYGYRTDDGGDTAGFLSMNHFTIAKIAYLIGDNSTLDYIDSKESEIKFSTSEIAEFCEVCPVLADRYSHKHFIPIFNEPCNVKTVSEHSPVLKKYIRDNPTLDEIDMNDVLPIHKAPSKSEFIEWYYYISADESSILGDHLYDITIAAHALGDNSVIEKIISDSYHLRYTDEEYSEIGSVDYTLAERLKHNRYDEDTPKTTASNAEEPGAPVKRTSSITRLTDEHTDTLPVRNLSNEFDILSRAPSAPKKTLSSVSRMNNDDDNSTFPIRSLTKELTLVSPKRKRATTEDVDYHVTVVHGSTTNITLIYTVADRYNGHHFHSGFTSYYIGNWHHPTMSFQFDTEEAAAAFSDGVKDLIGVTSVKQSTA